MLSYWSGAMAALRLLRCALSFHGLIEYKGGLRCRQCNPVRKRKQTKEEEASGSTTSN